MPRVGAIVVTTLVLAAIAVAACATNGAACAPGDYRYCPCATGARGYAQCTDDGTTYGACDCSGAIPAGAGILVEAGAPDASDSGAAAGLPFLASCGVSAECASNLCFPFNAYGPHCSHPCSKDLDCEAPSPGCSKMGACKLH